MINKIITDLQLRFSRALDKKTSWGRNQVQEIFVDCLSQTLAICIDKISDKPIVSPTNSPF